MDPKLIFPDIVIGYFISLRSTKTWLLRDLPGPTINSSSKVDLGVNGNQPHKTVVLYLPRLVTINSTSYSN